MFVDSQCEQMLNKMWPNFSKSGQKVDVSVFN